MAAEGTSESASGERSGFLDILRVFLRLGCTSFGGPVAHLGYFRQEFVERRKWLDEQAYADLVSLCQFLPGPASSQVGFSIGLKRGGLRGGLAAWCGFTIPSAVLMLLCAYGVGMTADLGGTGWVAGLKAGAVAVVANAVQGMGERLCTTRATASLAIAAAALLIVLPLPWLPVVVVAAGAAAGMLGGLGVKEPGVVQQGATLRTPVPSVVALGLFFLLLAGLPVLSWLADCRALDYAASFYSSGALVFGGGHVILPLLQAEVVTPGWVSQDAFLAGYGMAQALPGPLFTFAAYLGALMAEPPNGIAGSLLCLMAIFLPSILLLLGVMPHWERLREVRGVRSALTGTNAAVVGLLLAALYNPVFIEGVRRPYDLAVVLCAYALLRVWRQPAWAVVLLCGLAGRIGHGL